MLNLEGSFEVEVGRQPCKPDATDVASDDDREAEHQAVKKGTRFRGWVSIFV